MGFLVRVRVNISSVDVLQSGGVERRAHRVDVEGGLAGRQGRA
jgi:hypothetical protein